MENTDKKTDLLGSAMDKLRDVHLQHFREATEKGINDDVAGAIFYVAVIKAILANAMAHCKSAEDGQETIDVFMKDLQSNFDQSRWMWEVLDKMEVMFSAN